MSDMLDEALAEMDRHLGLEAEETPDPEASPEGASPQDGTPVPQEPEVTEQQQPRDDQGRFATKTPDEPAVAIPAVDDKFAAYLSRFGADADTFGTLPDPAQKALRAGYEADRMVGERGREYGELKKELEQLRETVTREPDQPPVQITQDMVDDDPMGSALLAYEQGNEHAFRVAFTAWKDEDPATAGAWAAAKASERHIAAVEEKWQQRYAELEQRVAPLAQTQDRTDVAAAWQAVKQQFPDADKYATKIQEAIDQAPEIAAALAQGTVEAKQRVIGNLYKIVAFDAASQAGTLLADAARTAEERQAQEAKAAKQEAFVGSGSQRNDPEPVSPGEQWLEEIGFDKAASRYYGDD